MPAKCHNNLPLISTSTRCLHLSDPAGLHLSGIPARRSSLPPQEEETTHPPRPIHSLLCSAVPPPTPGGPKGYFGQYGQHRPRSCHPPLKALKDKKSQPRQYDPHSKQNKTKQKTLATYQVETQHYQVTIKHIFSLWTMKGDGFGLIL